MLPTLITSSTTVAYLSAVSAAANSYAVTAINPVTKSTATIGNLTGGVFPNVFYGVPFNAQNFAALSAYIETIPAPDGKPRKVKPRIVAGGTDNRLAMASVFGAESIQVTDPLNANGHTNILGAL